MTSPIALFNHSHNIKYRQGVCRHILSVVALAPSPTSVAGHILAKAGHCVEFTVIAKRAGCGEIT
jgi:hypothetical protein